jgi:hypothetical protein
MTIDWGLVLTAGGVAVGAVVWFVRLEGRVNTNEALHASLKENHDELKDDVKYIRSRIDRALNGHGD